MRFVATSDTHFQFDVDDYPDGDVLLHAGDFMYTGYMDEWKERLLCFEKASAKYKHVILVPGNHDMHLQLYPGPAKGELRKRGVFVLGTNPTRPAVDLDGIILLGLPFVSGLPDWAFDRSSDWLANYVRQLPNADIVISHSPVRGYLDKVDDPWPGEEGGVGIRAYREYLQRAKPKVWINGHIHESYGEMEDKGTTFLNVCRCDRRYEQVNPPKVFEL